MKEGVLSFLVAIIYLTLKILPRFSVAMSIFLFLGPFSGFDHLQYTKKEGQNTGRGHGNYTIGDI